MDLNGDGRTDFLVAANGGGRGTGRALVFYGRPAEIGYAQDVQLRGSTLGERYGLGAANAGDINGDGFGDLVIGAAPFVGGPGSAYVYLGGVAGVSATPAIVLRGVGEADRFGLSVTSIGDANGDGYADIAVGALTADLGGRIDAGTVSVFHGGPSGLSSVPARVFEGMTAGTRLGWRLSAGDINGDGFGDLAVAAWNETVAGNVSAGAVHFYLGSSRGLPAVASSVLTGASTDDVELLGDTNGDGYDDVAVSAIDGGPVGAGVVWVYEGPLLTAAPSRLDGVARDDLFGVTIAGIGDVNGDGFGDFGIGTWAEAIVGLVDAGSARIYAGSASGFVRMPARTYLGVDTLDYMGVGFGE